MSRCSHPWTNGAPYPYASHSNASPRTHCPAAPETSSPGISLHRNLPVDPDTEPVVAAPEAPPVITQVLGNGYDAGGRGRS